MSTTDVYLDHASTTPVDPLVVEAMQPYWTERAGNPSSIHRRGRDARAAVDRARAQVAALLNAAPGDIVFTSGGTEADNLALRIAAAAGRANGRRAALTSTAEHHAVLRTAEALAEEGCEWCMLPVERNGAVSADAARAALNHSFAVVSLMCVNNETGAMNPVDVLGRACRDAGILFHTDAVQAAGKLTLDAQGSCIDLASMSAHKLHGPKGIGALYVRPGIAVAPMLFGGSQEAGRRGGTEAVPLIVGFGAAAELALRYREERLRRWTRQRADFIHRLRGAFPAVVINGEAGGLPSILSITFPADAFPIDGEALLMNLDLRGLAVSGGAACTAGSTEVSHVMRAIGWDPRSARATVRVSFGAGTTDDDVRAGAELLCAEVQAMLSRADATPASRSAMP
jgi:cysteine desulfurase